MIQQPIAASGGAQVAHWHASDWNGQWNTLPKSELTLMLQSWPVAGLARRCLCPAAMIHEDPHLASSLLNRTNWILFWWQTLRIQDPVKIPDNQGLHICNKVQMMTFDIPVVPAGLNAKLRANTEPSEIVINLNFFGLLKMPGLSAFKPFDGVRKQRSHAKI